jgi:hypothetical protein
MPRDRNQSDLARWRCALAAGCIVAPLVIVFSFSIVIHVLNWDLEGINLSLVKPQSTEASPSMLLWARDFSGQSNFAIISSFVWLTAVTALIFSWTIVAQHVRWRWLVWLVCMIAVCLFSYLAIQWHSNRCPELIPGHCNVLGLLKKVTSTAERASWLADANGIIMLSVVIMISLALYVVTIRDAQRHLGVGDLKDQRDDIRWLLALGSAVLVVGVLARKTLVDWEFSLLSQAEDDLKPIADALTLQLGAYGTLAIFAAFTPAVAAWQLDVAQLPKASNPRRDADDLRFAPMSIVSSLLAALAPLLASPLFNTFSQIVDRLSK